MLKHFWHQNKTETFMMPTLSAYYKERKKPKYYGKSKLFSYQNVPYFLTKKMHTQLGSLVQKQRS